MAAVSKSLESVIFKAHSMVMLTKFIIAYLVYTGALALAAEIIGTEALKP